MTTMTEIDQLVKVIHKFEVSMHSLTELEEDVKELRREVDDWKRESILQLKEFDTWFKERLENFHADVYL